MRICKKCGIEKEITLFRKLKKWFRHICKECYAKSYRTGKPNTGRFKKCHKPVNGFKKGQIGWWAGKRRSIKPLIEKQIPKPRFRDSGHRRARKSIEWSLAIRNRDGNKCTKCFSTEKLHAHHIVPWRISEELRYELSNGITLCSSCHSKEERRYFPRASWCKGKKFTEEHRKKISEAKKGKAPWNKGLKISAA